MRIISIQENQKEQWDEFIASNPSGSFLQSWSWGKFQESLGKKVWRLAAMENNEIISAALIIKQELPFRWSYLYCPRGPIVKSNISAYGGKYQKHALESHRGPKIANLFFEEVKKMAEKKKTVFLRVDPSFVIPAKLVLDSDRGTGIHDVKLGFAQARENFIDLQNLQNQRIWKKTKPIQPQHSLILDIKKNEEEILAQMKQKTRYNIRLAEKKGVKIKKISQPNNQEIQTFLNLTIQTSKRDKFKSHPEEYYQKMLKMLCRNSMTKLFFAEYQKKIITANIVVFFSDKAVYLHGASSNEHRNVMAPYLLQWEQIKEAKRLDCKNYDFWGIEKTENNEQRTMNRDWAGITKFKKGFGGEEISCPDSYDIILKPIPYLAYKIARKII